MADRDQNHTKPDKNKKQPMIPLMYRKYKRLREDIQVIFFIQKSQNAFCLKSVNGSFAQSGDSPHSSSQKKTRKSPNKEKFTKIPIFMD